MMESANSFVGHDDARTIIDNTAPDDWASFCEDNQW